MRNKKFSAFRRDIGVLHCFQGEQLFDDSVASLKFTLLSLLPHDIVDTFQTSCVIVGKGAMLSLPR